MKKKFLKTFLIALATFVVLWTGIIYLTLDRDESGELAEYQDNFLGRLIKGNDEITFLLLGVDTEDAAVSSSRTDTMILCKADVSTGEISMLSIPRDTKARIPGRQNEEKINHAHAYGGPELAVDAVKDLLGIDFNYYVRVDYIIVEDIVDMVGGVEVDVPVDMYDLKAGHQTLDADGAMKFLRFRKGYQNQDLGRIQAQQEFLKALIDKTLRVENVGKIPGLVRTYYSNVDTNIPLDTVLKFASNAKKFDTDNMQMATVPGLPQYINGVSYFIADKEDTDALVDQLFKNNNISATN